MKPFALLALLVFGSFILAGCQPMKNKELDNPKRDDTSKAMKQATGGDD